MYEIIHETSFDGLAAALEALDVRRKKLCVITDDVVNDLYGDEIRSILVGCCTACHTVVIPHGEKSKSLEICASVYDALIDKHFDRSDMIIALGGGVVGDLAGFVAATYMRGLPYVQIPTTLLAQADSSIGGKTAVDFKEYKNMVGAFNNPALVYMNAAALQTLDARQFSSGFAEIMKHGLIRDEQFYTWLVKHRDAICKREPDVLMQMVARSCEIKKAVVTADPEERGLRVILNFGHTIGHAIEKYKDFSLLHGECVALGCIAASYISYKRQMISEEQYLEIRDMFVPFGLPITVDGIDASAIVKLVASDKKMRDGKLQFVLLEGVGAAVVRTDVSESEIRAALRELECHETIT